MVDDNTNTTGTPSWRQAMVDWQLGGNLGGNIVHHVARDASALTSGEDVELPSDKAGTWSPFYESATEIFGNDDFDWDTIEDAPANSQMRADVVRAAKLIHEMTRDEGERAPTMGDDEWISFAKDEMSWFTQNTVGMGKWAKRLQFDNPTDEQKRAFGFLMEMHEHTNTSWGDVGNFLYKGLLADPTTYIGIGTLGIGTAAAQGGKLAAKQGIKAVIKAGLRSGLQYAVRGGARSGLVHAAQEGIEGAAKQGLRSTFARSVGETTVAQMVRNRSITTGLRQGWQTGATKIAIEGGLQGVYFDRTMHNTRLSIGLEDQEYTFGRGLASFGMGMAFGEVMGVGMKTGGAALSRGWKGVQNVWSNRPIIERDPNTLGMNFGNMRVRKRNAGNANTGANANAGNATGNKQQFNNASASNNNSASSREIMDPYATTLHKIYGGTIWKSKSLEEVGLKIPTKLGNWISKRRIKLANPFYTLPNRKIFGYQAVGNPASYLPSRVSMGKHIRKIIYRFDDAVRTRGLMDIGPNGKENIGETGPIVDLIKSIEGIKLSQYVTGTAEQRQRALSDAIAEIDKLANDVDFRKKLKGFQSDILRLRKDVEIETKISDLVRDIRHEDGARFTNTSNDITPNNSNGTVALRADVFREIKGLNNSAKNYIYDAIVAANKELRNAGQPELKPEDFINRLQSAATSDSGVTTLDPAQILAMSNWLEKSNEAVSGLLNVDANGQSLYGKNYRDFFENTINSYNLGDNSTFFERQLVQQLEDLMEIGYNPHVRLINKEADSFATNFSLKNLRNFGKRKHGLDIIRKLERQINEGVYAREKRVAYTDQPPWKPNAENFGIRVELANEGETQKIGDLVLKAYEQGYSEEAIYSLQYLKYRAGANSKDEVFAGLRDYIEKNAPPTVKAKNSPNPIDGEWNKFISRIREIDNETFHAPIERGQRDVLATFARETFWPRMGRRFPGDTKEVSFPTFGKYVIDPTKRTLLNLVGYTFGARARPINVKDGTLTSFSLHTGKSLRKVLQDAEVPKGYERPEGAPDFVNENKWLRRAFWFEKKGTTTFDGKKKNIFQRAPIWMQMPLRVAGAPLALGYEASRGVWRIAGNKFIKPVIATTAIAGLSLTAIEEGRELVFNDGNDFDPSMPWNDIGQKYILDPLMWTADQALVSPLRMGVAGTYRLTDALTGDFLPDYQTLTDDQGRSYLSYADAYNLYKGATGYEIGGLSLLDRGEGKTYFRDPSEVSEEIVRQKNALQTALNNNEVKAIIADFQGAQGTDLENAASTLESYKFDVDGDETNFYSVYINAANILRYANEQLADLQTDIEELNARIQTYANLVETPSLAESQYQKAIDTAQQNLSTQKALYDALSEAQRNNAQHSVVIAYNDAKETLETAQENLQDAQDTLVEDRAQLETLNAQKTALAEALRPQKDNVQYILNQSATLEGQGVLKTGTTTALQDDIAELMVILNSTPAVVAELKQEPVVEEEVAEEEIEEEEPDVVTSADGTVTTTETDGTVSVKKPDGTTIVTTPDGQITSTAPDGTITVVSTDGKITTTAPDGAVTVTDPSDDPSALERLADNLPSRGDVGKAARSMYDDLFTFKTGDAAIDNTLSNVGEVIWGTGAGIADWGRNTYKNLRSSSQGNLLLSAGGGLLTGWVTSAFIGKWFEKTWIGRIPFIGSALKLAMTVGGFLLGMKLTKNMLGQGSGTHTPANPTIDASGNLSFTGTDSMREQFIELKDQVTGETAGAASLTVDDNAPIVMPTIAHNGAEPTITVWVNGETPKQIIFEADDQGNWVGQSGKYRFAPTQLTTGLMEGTSGAGQRIDYENSDAVMTLIKGNNLGQIISNDAADVQNFDVRRVEFDIEVGGQDYNLDIGEDAPTLP